MKRFACLSILFFNLCWSASEALQTSSLLPKFVSNDYFKTKADALANSPTSKWFSIDNIDEQSLQAKIAWGETNMQSLTPFNHVYEETWQLSAGNIQQLKALDPQADHARLWALLNLLADKQSIKIASETTTDDAMVAFDV